MFTMISERTHRAARRYCCIWCGELILQGTLYVREFSTFDGEIQNHAWHPECRDAADAYFQTGENDEFSPYDNERPLSFAEQEYQSWDCAMLAQSRITP